IFSPKVGEALYKEGDYGNSVFIIVSGEVGVQLDPSDPAKLRPIKAGRIFGEMALISGRPRSAAVIAGKDCVLTEVPRRAVRKLIAANDSVRAYIDRVFSIRALERYLVPGIDESLMREGVESATMFTYKAQTT